MKFEFNGQEFDSDKPIFVQGYEILHYWCTLKKENLPRVLLDSAYRICCKKMYVIGIDLHFNKVIGKNEVLALRLLSSDNRIEVRCDYDRNVCMLGHSVSECKKQLEEWRKEI